jgi:ATP/maltotriose-dependent transcriptional regulator MalT
VDLRIFKESLLNSEPLQNTSVYLKALWYDAKGDWDKAHKVIQDVEDKNASWIHAYLHRKEGDKVNADYWYSKADKTRPALTLEQEWEELVGAFIMKVKS